MLGRLPRTAGSTRGGSGCATCVWKRCYFNSTSDAFIFITYASCCVFLGSWSFLPSIQRFFTDNLKRVQQSAAGFITSRLDSTASFLQIFTNALCKIRFCMMSHAAQHVSCNTTVASHLTNAFVGGCSTAQHCCVDHITTILSNQSQVL